MVSGSHSSPTGVLLTFRSPYLFTIGGERVFSVAGWSPRIQSGFHVTRPTQVPLGRQFSFRVQGCHPLWPTVPGRSASRLLGNSRMRGPPTPQGKPPRFRLVPFRSPLLRKSIFLSFPLVTEMFQFTRFATCAYGFSTDQFGYPGIKARLSTPPGLSQTSTPFHAF